MEISPPLDIYDSSFVIIQAKGGRLIIKDRSKVPLFYIILI